MKSKICLILLAFAGFLWNKDNDHLFYLNGSPLKVIAGHDRVKIYTSPGEPKSRGWMNAFSFALVFRQNPRASKAPNGYYLIGMGIGEHDALGFVKETEVVEWQGRKLICFTSPEKRKPVFVFSRRSQLITFLSNPRYGRAAAQSRERKVEGSEDLFMPVLNEVSEFSRGAGNVRFYQVAYALENRLAGNGPALKLPKRTLDEFKEASRMNVLFLVDTTASMGSFAEAGKRFILEIAAHLRKNNEASQFTFGWMSYRDNNEGPGLKGFSPVSAGSELTGDYRAFEKSLDRLRVTNQKSGDASEALFDSLVWTLDRNLFPRKGIHFVVVVADAPAHLPGSSKNPSGYSETDIMAKARRKNIRISGIQILHPANTLEEEKRLTNQLTQLSMGAEPHLAGIFHQYDRFQVKDAYARAEFISDFFQLMERYKRLNPNDVMAPSLETSITHLAPANGEHPGSRQLYTGWLAERQGRQEGKGVRENVLVFRKELKQLHFFLYAAQTLVRASDKKIASKRLKTEFQKITGHSINPDENWRDFLMYSAGLPVHGELFRYFSINYLSDHQNSWNASIIEQTLVNVEKYLRDEKIWRSMGPHSQLKYAIVSPWSLP